MQASALHPRLPCLHCLIMEEAVLPYRNAIKNLIDLKMLPPFSSEEIAHHIFIKVIECLCDHLAVCPDLKTAARVRTKALAYFDAEWQHIVQGTYKSMDHALDEGHIPVDETTMPSWWPKKSAPDDPTDDPTDDPAADDGSTPTTG